MNCWTMVRSLHSRGSLVVFKKEDAHEPDRCKSPRAHTLWTWSYAPGPPLHAPGMSPGAVQDPFEADFIVQ